MKSDSRDTFCGQVVECGLSERDLGRPALGGAPHCGSLSEKWQHYAQITYEYSAAHSLIEYSLPELNKKFDILI